MLENYAENAKSPRAIRTAIARPLFSARETTKSFALERYPSLEPAVFVAVEASFKALITRGCT